MRDLFAMSLLMFGLTGIGLLLVWSIAADVVAGSVAEQFRTARGLDLFA
jgi:hypothetical protein